MLSDCGDKAVPPSLLLQPVFLLSLVLNSFSLVRLSFSCVSKGKDTGQGFALSLCVTGTRAKRHGECSERNEASRGAGA